MLEKLKSNIGEKGAIYGVPILLIVGLLIAGYGVYNYSQSEEGPHFAIVDTVHNGIDGHIEVNGQEVKSTWTGNEWAYDNISVSSGTVTVEYIDEAPIEALWCEVDSQMGSGEDLVFQGSEKPSTHSSPWELNFNLNDGNYELRTYISLTDDSTYISTANLQVGSAGPIPTPTDSRISLALIVVGGLIAVAGFYYKV